ncbi:MAG: indole-3-glycerol phosphate synthase TrpC [Nitrospirae bacterium]|nr:indole-3-glycerol phosphate synthase TrpC [Nitrospirota bacterium]
MSILSEITKKKKERLITSKSIHPISELKGRINNDEIRDFKAALFDPPLKLIAEIKKASPSKGIIRPDFDPITVAKIYNDKKVDAISVLTEEDFFEGNIDYILMAKEVTKVPILRKDFLFEEYQIYESRAFGADAILLIAAILSKEQAGELLQLSRELGMSVLFEVHNLKELDMAMYLNCEIIGINNRNLKTLEISINTTLEMIKDIPKDKIVVSESGIKSRQDVKTIEQSGANAILVGTQFMSSKDIGSAIDKLMSL